MSKLIVNVGHFYVLKFTINLEINVSFVIHREVREDIIVPRIKFEIIR